MVEYKPLEELEGYSVSKLKKYCTEVEIDIEGLTTKQEILDEIEGTYEDLTEITKIDQENPTNKSPFDEESAENDNEENWDDDGEFTGDEGDILKQIFTPQLLIIRIRKRLLNEKFDYKKKKYFRTSQKRPLVSKSFANIFEAKIISVFNSQNSIVKFENDEIRKRMRHQLKNMNRLILNTPGINPIYRETIFLLFEDLMITGYKMAQNGWIAKFLKDYNAKKNSEKTDEKKKTNKDKFLEEAI